MALAKKPDEIIFASGANLGEVTTFPDIPRGWGISFEQTGGIPPMEWFNFLFKRIDERFVYFMQRGLPEWSATQDYAVGSCVQYEGLSYRALKAGKNNNPNENDSEYWVRWGFDSSDIVKASTFNHLFDLFIGIPIPHPLTTVPEGCLAMNGQRFDKARYPKLAQKYPSGQLPDLRGEFIRGWDNGRRVDTGRGLLSAQGDAIRNITGEIKNMAYQDIDLIDSTGFGVFSNDLNIKDSAFAINGVAGIKVRTNGDVIKFDASRVVPTASENRPRNIAYHYICLAA